MRELSHGIGRAAARLIPLLLLLLSAQSAAGQVIPPPPDTLRADTLAARDTAVTDTLPPARELFRFPLLPSGGHARVTAGEWVWDREALLREGATSLVDLLQRIPGVATFRGGMFVQPEAAAAFGATAGRLEVELDGYVLDPLAGGTFDLSTLPIGQIRELRVQRRLGLLRIRILTDYPEHAIPYTRVEAGIGQPPANMFRGMLLVPHLAVGPLSLTVERLDTDGTGGAEPGSLFSVSGKWAWTDSTRGVQLELLNTTLEREAGSPWPVDRTRQDVLLRARNSFTPQLLGEVYAGRSRIDETVPDETEPRRTELATVQAGGRLRLQLPETVVSAAFRYRDAEFLPRTELSLDADVGLGPVQAGGEVIRSAWPGTSATYYGVHAEVGQFYGASVFGEYTGGSRGARAVWDAEQATVVSDRSGWRAGVALQLGSRASGSIAAVNLSQDGAYPFGLPFDTAGERLTVGDARGLEAHGRLVLVPRWLAIESWINDWSSSAGWVYMPIRSWRTAVELHAVPLESGNLEVFGRLEGAHRSGAIGFDPARTDPELTPFVTLPAYTTFNGYLQIRIIDVRIFIRWDDLVGQQVEDLPGRFHRGPRIFYGVKWNLWN